MFANNPDLVRDRHVMAIRPHTLRKYAERYLTALEQLDRALLGGHLRPIGRGHGSTGI